MQLLISCSFCGRCFFTMLKCATTYNAHVTQLCAPTKTQRRFHFDEKNKLSFFVVFSCANASNLGHSIKRPVRFFTGDDVKYCEFHLKMNKITIFVIACERTVVRTIYSTDSCRPHRTANEPTTTTTTKKYVCEMWMRRKYIFIASRKGFGIFQLMQRR